MLRLGEGMTSGSGRDTQEGVLFSRSVSDSVRILTGCTGAGYSTLFELLIINREIHIRLFFVRPREPDIILLKIERRGTGKFYPPDRHPEPRTASASVRLQ